MKQFLFCFYGTLKYNERNHYLPKELGMRYIGDAEIPGYTLVDFSYYPAAVKRDGCSIQVEVYETDEVSALKRLDQFERADGPQEECLYIREQIDTVYGPAWIYVLNPFITLPVEVTNGEPKSFWSESSKW